MPCNHKCAEWKAKRPTSGERYSEGQVFCGICDIFMYPSKEHTHNTRTNDADDNPENGLSCNCCNSRISTRSYSSRYSKYKNPNELKTLDELEKYLKEEIQPKSNYQFVIIKTLLENPDEESLSTDKIKEEIKFYNKSQQSIDYDVGFETLMKHGFIIMNDDRVILNINESYLTDQKSLELISICNRYIYQNMNPEKVQHFTAVGGYDNWQHTITNPPFQWAITTTNPSNIAVWELANEHDLVYYYPTQDNSPYNKRGFFGIGVIKKKMIDNSLYWPDETSEIKSKYPNKIILDTLHMVFDEDELIEVPSSTGLPFVKGFNRIADEENKKKLFTRTNEQWKIFPQEDTRYFLFRYNPEQGIAEEIFAKKYHYSPRVHNQKLLAKNSKVIWYSGGIENYSFWGYGDISNLDDADEEHKYAVFDDFTVFNPTTKFEDIIPRKGNDSIKEKLKSLPSFNNQHSINPITKEIYDEIINAKSMTKPEKLFDDNPLGVSEVDFEKFAKLILEDEFELAIDINIVKRILRHLNAGKHVILVGAPGVGKTELAKRILKIYGKKVTGNEYLRSVASAEWTRRDVIGGIDLEHKFQPGFVTTASKEGKWLLIDEFNRADINKAFGEMFFAIEDMNIPLREEEKIGEYSSGIITIPDDFRMICTMNDFDKNLLLTELSYGLITRFAFVDIKPDIKKEQNSVKDQVLFNESISDKDYEKCKIQISAYFNFINEVRQLRMIGVRTSIDITKYVVTASKESLDDDNLWNYLDEAICDYLLPQFDRLDRKVINHVLKSAQAKFNQHTKDFVDGISNMNEQLERISNFLGSENE